MITKQEFKEQYGERLTNIVFDIVKIGGKVDNNAVREELLRLGIIKKTTKIIRTRVVKTRHYRTQKDHVYIVATNGRGQEVFFKRIFEEEQE